MAARKIRTCTDGDGRKRVVRCADDPRRVQLCAEVCGFLPKSSATLHDDAECGGFDETERFEYPDIRFVDPWRGVFVEWEGEGQGTLRAVRLGSSSTWVCGFGPGGSNVIRDAPPCYSYRNHDTAVSNFTASPKKPEDGIAIEIEHFVAGSVRTLDCVQLGSIDGIYSRMVGRVVNVLPTGACDETHRNSGAGLQFPVYRGDSKVIAVTLSGMAGCGCSLTSYSWKLEAGGGGRWLIDKVGNPFNAKDDCTQRDIAGRYVLAKNGTGERLVVLRFNSFDHGWQQGVTKGNAASTIVIENIE